MDEGLEQTPETCFVRSTELCCFLVMSLKNAPAPSSPLYEVKTGELHCAVMACHPCGVLDFILMCESSRGITHVPFPLLKLIPSRDRSAKTHLCRLPLPRSRLRTDGADLDRNKLEGRETAGLLGSPVPGHGRQDSVMLPIQCNKSILNGLLQREPFGAGRPQYIWKVFSVSWEGEVLVLS